MSLKFLKQMAEKYNFVYIEHEKSIYLEFEQHRSNAPYQVAKWYPSTNHYIVFTKCKMIGNQIVTSNDKSTWVNACTDTDFEKLLIKFVANYKETLLQQKIKIIEKDF